MESKIVVKSNIIPDKFIGDAKISKPFIFDYLDLLEIPEYEPDTNFIISNWNSNHYITTIQNGLYKINDSHGEPLKLATEYILIRPRY